MPAWPEALLKYSEERKRSVMDRGSIRTRLFAQRALLREYPTLVQAQMDRVLSRRRDLQRFALHHFSANPGKAFHQLSNLAEFLAESRHPVLPQELLGLRDVNASLILK